MHIGMRMQPPRAPVSIIAQAIGVLRAKGGSWWQPGPAYTFTGSDGTGAAGDGSDSGYGVDLCASYGPELVPSGWLGASDSFTTPELAAVKTVDAVAGTIGLELSGTAFTAFSDPIKNLLGDNVPTAGGEVLELSAAGSESVSPAGASTKLLLVEMDAGLTYLRGTLVALGSKAVVVLGSDCRFIRIAVYVGNWAAGAEVSASITLQKPSLRQIIGRPLFQSTTGFKPKLKRVPKRLGPELVTNGGFSSAAEWVAGSGWAISGGAAQATAGHPWSTVAQAAASLRAGVSYLVSADVSRSSGTLYVQLATVGASVTPFFATASGSFSGVATMPAGTSPSIALLNDGAGSFSGSVDNISVREVLEWGWAWVFDGADDYLGAAAKTGESGYLAVAFAESGVRWQALLGSGGQTTGDAGVSLGLTAGNELSLLSGNVSMANSRYIASASKPVGACVASATWGSTSADRAIRLDGVDISFRATAYSQQSESAGGLVIGRISTTTTDFFCGEIFAAAYCPGTLSGAELRIVERAMAQVGGITI